MRLDKFLSEAGIATRSELKKIIKAKQVSVNDEIITKADYKINEEKDIVKLLDEFIPYHKFMYYMLYKPAGYISATEGNVPCVIDLVPNIVKGLFPVGRLDKDTTGLMIISDDGDFAHNILSPKKHVSKKYYVELSGDLSTTMVDDFKNGIKLIDGECKSSTLEIIDKRKCYVTLTEGRYHQIKRMFGCYGLEVLELKRIKIGNLELPKELEEGSCRELTQEELNSITEKGKIA